VTTSWWNSHEEIDNDLKKLIKIVTQQWAERGRPAPNASPRTA